MSDGDAPEVMDPVVVERRTAILLDDGLPPAFTARVRDAVARIVAPAGAVIAQREAQG